MTTTTNKSPVNGCAVRRRAELRDFLTSRRARISPEAAGMPSGAGRRRTPGLRREEVAVLAGVGVSWYQWLEQGRDITVSGQVLDAIGTVLQLTEPERQHLYSLAGLTPPPLRKSPQEGREGCCLALKRMIDAWLPNPGHIVDRYWNITAMNTSAQLVFDFEVGSNCLVDFFEQRLYQRGYHDPEEVTRRVAAQYRAEMTNHPGDPGYAAIVERLLRTSERFAEVWNLHEVQALGTNQKVIMHPKAGELHFESTQLRIAEWPDLTVVMHTPLAETDTKARLESMVTEHERRHGLRVVA